MNNIVIFLLVALISSPAFSIQTYSVSDGDSIQIKVSSKDLTRIRMDSGRLDGAWGLDENFTHKADRSKGEIFVRPKPGAPTTSSFFIKDGNGSVYSVTAVQHAIPSDTVVLKSLDYTAKRDSSQSSRKASSDVKRIKRLVKAMARGEGLSGYSRSSKKAEVELWKNIEIVQVDSYVGRDFEGEVYAIRNSDEKDHVFHESEFRNFGEHVRFAGLDKLKIVPNETTTLYVVREAK